MRGPGARLISRWPRLSGRVIYSLSAPGMTPARYTISLVTSIHTPDDDDVGFAILEVTVGKCEPPSWPLFNHSLECWRGERVAGREAYFVA